VDDPLEALLAGARVWRARDGSTAPGGPSAADPGVLPTGWPALDAALPGGGWPLGTLVELLVPTHGVGELTLLLPALRALHGRWVLWIAPPHAPYPPALAQAGLDPARVLLVDADAPTDRLWAMEQALRSRGCGAVLMWLDAVDDRWLRRLKLAAEPGRALAVLFRPAARGAEGSAAALRLALEPADDRLDVRIVKGRGGPRQVRNVLQGGAPWARHLAAGLA
jgi:cell division inhibitor SulA/protein ImuA